MGDVLERNQGTRILIVEHDETTTATYARLLRLEGYTVLTVPTGEAGLREAELARPDVFIVDFHMPDIDGLEFLRRLRMSDGHRNTPVAIVTGDYLLGDTISERLKELGAVVRFKPFWLEELIHLVHGLLHSENRSD